VQLARQSGTLFQEGLLFAQELGLFVQLGVGDGDGRPVGRGGQHRQVVGRQPVGVAVSRLQHANGDAALQQRRGQQGFGAKIADLDLAVDGQTGNAAARAVEPHRLAGFHDVAGHSGAPWHYTALQRRGPKATDGHELQIIVAYRHDNSYAFRMQQRGHFIHDTA